MDKIYHLVNKYIENKISIRELKIFLLNNIEKNDEPYSKKIRSIFILIDSYDEKYSYKNSNNIVYAVKKILFWAGIDEDPITEIEIKKRLKKILKNSQPSHRSSM